MYRPSEMTHWQGRVDSEEGPLARRWHQCIEALPQQPEPGITLLGFASDAGVMRNHGRVGAKEGPIAIRRALANLAWHHHSAVYDAGDIICLDDELESAQQELSQHISTLLAVNQFPLIMGGGHEIAFGSFSGLAQYAKTFSTPPSIGIINLDAHFDLRAAQRANSGTPFRQIADFCKSENIPFHYLVYGIAQPSNTQALFQRASELNVIWRSDEECVLEKKADLLNTLIRFSNQVDWLYLTVCLDVLPMAIAPGVSAPAIKGVDLAIVEILIDAIKATGKLKLADIAELNPVYDHAQQTAKVAARLIWRMTK